MIRAYSVDLWMMLFIAAGVTAVAIVLWARERSRQAEFRELAVRHGFTYLGHALPRSINLRGTGLEDATAVANTIDGEHHGTRVVSFDCRVPTGEGTRRLTAIAVQGPPEVFGAHLPGDLIIEGCGEWSVMYERNNSAIFQSSVMSASEVEAHLNWIFR